MIGTALNINTLYGEIARDVATINDVETLEKIRKYVSRILNAKHAEHNVETSKADVLEDLRTSCKEYKMYSSGEKELQSFDDVLNSL